MREELSEISSLQFLVGPGCSGGSGCSARFSRCVRIYARFSKVISLSQLSPIHTYSRCTSRAAAEHPQMLVDSDRAHFRAYEIRALRSTSSTLRREAPVLRGRAWSVAVVIVPPERSGGASSASISILMACMSPDSPAASISNCSWENCRIQTGIDKHPFLLIQKRRIEHCHSRLPAFIAASAVRASANSRTTAVAASANRRGCRMVGLTGQRMTTTAGVSSASTNSTVTRSDALISLEASYVTWDIGVSLPH